MFDRPDANDMRDRLAAERALLVWRPGPHLLGAIVIVGAAIVGVTMMREDEGVALALTRVTWWLLLHAFGSLAAAEYVHARPRPDHSHVVRSQSLYGVAIACLVIAVGATATQLRADYLAHSDPRVWALWIVALAGVAWSSVRIAQSTAALIRGGAHVTDTLETTLKEAEATRLRTLQYKSGPDVMLRSLSAIATCATTAPAQAEGAIGALADYIRDSQRRDEASTMSLADEVTMTRAYVQVLERAGAAPPITWQVDDDAGVRSVPTGTLRTLVDYAIARCTREPAAGATISIRANVVRGRLVIVVADTAPPDGESAVEPDAHWALRARLDAPARRGARVDVPTMLDVDAGASGTTQRLWLPIEEAA
jgi:hypothetical protein